MSAAETVITAGDVLSQALSRGVQPITDEDVRTACRECGHSQCLAEGARSRRGVEIIYRCCRCTAMVLVVGVPEKTRWAGRGYRLGDFTIRNPSDIHVCLRDKTTGQQTRRGMFFPRSPHALAERR